MPTSKVNNNAIYAHRRAGRRGGRLGSLQGKKKKKESPISFRFLYQTLSGHIDFRSGKEKLRNWLPSPLEETRARMADGAVAQVGQIIVEYLLD